MIQIWLGPNINADIKSIAEYDRKSASDLTDILKEYFTSSSIASALFHQSNASKNIDTMWFFDLKKRGINIARCKFIEKDNEPTDGYFLEATIDFEPLLKNNPNLKKYRILYGIDFNKRKILIFAIVDRGKFNYEFNNPITERCVRLYNGNGVRSHNRH